METGGASVAGSADDKGKVTITDASTGSCGANRLLFLLDLVAFPVVGSLIVHRCYILRPEHFFDNPACQLVILVWSVAWVQRLFTSWRTIAAAEFDGTLAIRRFLVRHAASKGEVDAVELVRQDAGLGHKPLVFAVFHLARGSHYTVFNASTVTAHEELEEQLEQACRQHGVRFEAVKRGYDAFAVNWRRLFSNVAYASSAILVAFFR